MCKLQFRVQRYTLFAEKETFMNKWRIISLFLTVTLLMTEAAAGPVCNTEATYTQPDGTRFSVSVSGDEWMRVRKTADGCAIVKGEDGWWCYGTYDSEGRLHSSGYAVGKSAPANVISASRQIPYRTISEKSARYRSVNSGAPSISRSLRRQYAPTKSGEGTIEKKAIVLLVEFSDVKFQYTKEDFEKLMNEPGYKGIGSVKDYFEEQFGDGWEFTFYVSDIITLDWTVKHYGANDSEGQDVRPWDMVAEACEKAHEMGINFAEYDQDGDDYVDNVYVFYAGQSEAEHSEETDLIWPHSYYIFSGEGVDCEIEGKRIDRYACSAEIYGERSLTGIGSFCHEYAHTLGLVDLYDTDYDENGGWAAGTWNFTSLMDGGSYNNNSSTPPYFNCIEREILGITEPISLEAGKSYTLEPIHISNTCYRLDSGEEDEYYLFECRSNNQWDKHIGGKGMLVYHIDKIMKVQVGVNELTTWQWNTVNATQSHQCADLIEADGRSDKILSMSQLYVDIRGIFFPQTNATALPEIRWWYSPTPDIAVTGITSSGSNVSFNVIRTAEVVEVAKVTNATFISFADAAIIMFDKNDPTFEGQPSLSWRPSGTEEEYRTAEVVEYATGKYACKLTDLQSGNVSYETLIRFEGNGNIGDSYKLSFMTKRGSAVPWPYLYISDNQIAKGAGFPLHIVNATEAEAISWEYNDTAVTPGKDFHFYPETSGTLKAIVMWEDGSNDIIIKKIEVE